MADQAVAGTSRARRALLLRVLRRSLTGRPRDAGWLAAWSLVQALPALVSGWAVARATSDFLAGGAGTRQGTEWLALIGLAALASALASRQTYLRVAALVEPLRGDLVRMIVTAALQNATWDPAPRDTGAVARITHQAEIVRDTFAGLLAVGLTFAFTVVSAVIGLAALVPAIVALAVAPMAVSVRGVSFAYGPFAEPVLHDLDLDIPDGGHLAIVGPSGIGKSTLAGLVAGLLRPLAGEVRLGGAPTTEIAAADLPRYRVLIPQEAYVFAGTLAQNLSYHAPEATQAELDASVDAVGLRDLVTRLGGYRAHLVPSALSAGERQLIALARAYLSPARLAILDEATSHLDPAAAARAESALAARPGTLIVIAHRMSSALRAQQVLVLDGSCARIGDHATLLATSPLYRDLVGHWQADHPPGTSQHDRRGRPGPAAAGRSGRRPGRV